MEALYIIGGLILAAVLWVVTDRWRKHTAWHRRDAARRKRKRP